MGDVGRRIAEIWRVLKPGALYQGTMLPTRNINYGRGRTVAPDTFVVDHAEERGHPHFYCDAATLVALYAMGMLFASLFMLYGREAWNTASLLQEPVYFLSGAYFPGFFGPIVPFAIQAAGSLIPMTIGLDAIRRLAIGGGDIGSVWLHIIALVVCTLILFPIAQRALSYMESLGKKEGRLTLRWQ